MGRPFHVKSFFFNLLIILKFFEHISEGNQLDAPPALKERATIYPLTAGTHILQTAAHPICLAQSRGVRAGRFVRRAAGRIDCRLLKNLDQW
jgi:hypothetical protein